MLILVSQINCPKAAALSFSIFSVQKAHLSNICLFSWGNLENMLLEYIQEYIWKEQFNLVSFCHWSKGRPNITLLCSRMNIWRQFYLPIFILPTFMGFNHLLMQVANELHFYLVTCISLLDDWNHGNWSTTYSSWLNE